MDSSSPHHKSPQKETGPQAWDRVARLNQARFCRRYPDHLPLVTTWPLNRGYRKESDIRRDEGALADTLRNYEAMASSSMVVKNHNALVFVSKILMFFCFCFYILDSRISLSQLTEWDISSHWDPSMQTPLMFPYCPSSVKATNLPG